MKHRRQPIFLSIFIVAILLFVSNRSAAADNGAAPQPAPMTDLGDSSAEQVAQLLSETYAGTHHLPPIILVHGWQGINADKTDCDDTDPSDPDFNYVDDNWELVDEELEAMGFFVEFVRSKSGYTSPTSPETSEVNCTPVAEANAHQVALAIDRALADSQAQGQEKVILIAHSMGGLVSRAYMESSLYRDDVVALYTMGTPHIGVPTDVLNAWIEVITLGNISLSEYCLYQPIVCQFSDNESANPAGYTGIETFNNSHQTRAAGVYYHMLGGDIDFDHRSLTCDPIYLLIPGLNDCIVPRPSAEGISSANGSLGPLSGVIDRRDVYAAHVESFTDTPTFGCDYTYSYHNKNYYCSGSLELLMPSNSMTSCLAPTIQDRLSGHTCGTVGALPKIEPTTPYIRVPALRATLQSGESLTRMVYVEGGDALFTVHYRDADAAFSLIAPDGQVIDAQNVADWPNVTLKADENGQAFMVRAAEAGGWQMYVSAGSEAATVMTVATLQSSLAVTFAFDSDSYRADQTATLIATVSGEMSAAEWTATLTTRSGQTQTVTFSAIGDGRYQAQINVPDDSGYADITMHFSALSAAGVPVSQAYTRLLQIEGDNLALNGDFEAAVEPALAKSNPTRDFVVRVGVDSYAAGSYGLSADLVDENGVVVSHSSSGAAELGLGRDFITLRFRGASLTSIPANGELTLTNAVLVDYTLGGIVVSMASDVSTLTVTNLDAKNSLSSQSGKVPQIDNSPHTCTLTPPADSNGYLPGDTITINCNITLQDEDEHNEWLDGYFINAPDAWNISSQTTAPADASGWSRTTVATPCNTNGVAYWGVQNAHHSASTGIAPFDVIAPCDLSLNNLPVSGSHNGPWLAAESGEVLMTEGFEGTFTPSGWTSWDTDGGSDNTSWQKSSSQAYGGSFSAFHNDDGTCFFCTGDITSWLVMPLRTVHAGDTLAWRQYITGDESGFASDFDLWISEGSNDPNSGDFSEWFDLDKGTEDSWTGWIYDLSDFTGKQIYIAFRYDADDDEELYLDEIRILNDRIQTTTYNFSADYVVQSENQCPGSPFVGLSALATDDVAGLSCNGLGDLIDYSLNSATCSVGQVCPLPAITLSVTVSDDGTCPGSATIEMPEAAQDVTYCYSITNTSTASVTVQDFVINDPDVGVNNVSVPTQVIAAGSTAVVYSTTYNHALAAGACADNGAAATATTASGIGQPQGQAANVAFVSTTYAVSDTTAADETTVCVSAPTAVNLSMDSAETVSISKHILSALVMMLLALVIVNFSKKVGRKAA